MAIQDDTGRERPPPEGPRVLLVEDDPSARTVVGQLLDEAGYEYLAIADHKQIVDAILRWKPRCIILDSDPGPEGGERSWGEAFAIRRAYPEIPVLMFTANPSATAEAKAGTSARAKVAGYAGVLDKPFVVLEFLATLKQAVEKTGKFAAQSGTAIDG